MAHPVPRRRRARPCPAAGRHNNSNPARRAPLNPLLSGLSPCPKLEPPSGVNPSPAAWASPCRPRPSPAQAISHALIGYDRCYQSILTDLHPQKCKTPRRVREARGSRTRLQERWAGLGSPSPRRPTAPRQTNRLCQMNQHSGALSNHWPNHLASAHLEL